MSDDFRAMVDAKIVRMQEENRDMDERRAAGLTKCLAALNSMLGRMLELRSIAPELEEMPPPSINDRGYPPERLPEHPRNWSGWDDADDPRPCPSIDAPQFGTITYNPFSDCWFCRGSRPLANLDSEEFFNRYKETMADWIAEKCAYGGRKRKAE